MVARDASGHGRDATLSEPVWVEQAEGSALNLDSLDDFVDYGNIAAIGIGGPLTIEAWIKPLRQTTTDTNLFGEDYRTHLMTYYRRRVMATRPLCIAVWNCDCLLHRRNKNSIL